jgi:hypothetical protein
LKEKNPILFWAEVIQPKNDFTFISGIKSTTTTPTPTYNSKNNNKFAEQIRPSNFGRQNGKQLQTSN